MAHFSKFVPFLLALVASVSLAQTPSFRIVGKMGSFKPASKAYLFYSNPTTGKGQEDSTQLDKGRFTFTGPVPVPTQAYLYVADSANNYNMVQLMIEPGTIHVTSPDSLNNAVVRGGLLNADFDGLMTKLKPLRTVEAQLLAQYQTARKALPGGKLTKAFSDVWDKKFEAIEEQRKPIYQQFIQQMPNSMVSIEAIKEYGGYAPDVAVVKPLFGELSPAVRNSPAGQAYAARLAQLEGVAVGAVAPNFSQADTLGKVVSLADFKGKYVLLDFWASWCGPCRQENPNLVKTFHQFKDRNFTVLGISLDKSKDAWLKAIQKDHLSWAQVSDLKAWENEVARQYTIRSIPQNVLIDPQGRIVAKNLRGEELAKKLAGLLPTATE